MAEGDVSVYYNAKLRLAWDQLAFGGGGWPFYMMLVHDYTPDLSGHTIYSQIDDAWEYETANGYTHGGKQVLNFTWALDSSTGVMTVGCSSVSWAPLGPLSPPRPSHAIMYSTHGTDPSAYWLALVWELGAREPDGGTFSLIVPPTGILQLV